MWIYINGKFHYICGFVIAMLNYQTVMAVSREMMISDWWYTYPSEKYEFVNWDDDIPNISKPPTSDLLSTL